MTAAVARCAAHPRRHDHCVSNGPMQDPPFCAVEYPAVTATSRCRSHIGKIEARLAFGMGKSGAPRSVDDPRNEPLAQLPGASMTQATAGEHHRGEIGLEHQGT